MKCTCVCGVCHGLAREGAVAVVGRTHSGSWPLNGMYERIAWSFRAVCSCCDIGMVCVLREASPARGERPISEILSVMVYEGGIMTCMYSIECFGILSACMSVREGSALAYPSPRKAVGHEGVAAKWPEGVRWCKWQGSRVHFMT